jgi:hypothetical protein
MYKHDIGKVTVGKNFEPSEDGHHLCDSNAATDQEYFVWHRVPISHTFHCRHAAIHTKQLDAEINSSM